MTEQVFLELAAPPGPRIVLACLQTRECLWNTETPETPLAETALVASPRDAFFSHQNYSMTSNIARAGNPASARNLEAMTVETAMHRVLVHAVVEKVRIPLSSNHCRCQRLCASR